MLLQIIQLTGLFGGVGYLVHSYSDKQVKPHIKILSFVAWLLSFCFVVILPLDIYWTIENHMKINDCIDEKKINHCEDFDGVSISEYKSMVWTWRTIYWITFIFTWLVLPFFQDYEAAGEFDKIGRIKKSIKINLAIILGIGAIGMIFIIYLLARGTISWDNMEGFLIGLANGFGIFLVVILLGHGLVKIPKKYWRERFEEIVIKLCYFQAVQIDESKISTRFTLESKVKVLLLAQQKYPEFNNYFDIILESVPKNVITYCKELDIQNESTKQELNTFGSITVDKLATLNKQVKYHVALVKRADARWDALLDEAFFSQDLIDNQFSSDNKIQSVFSVQRQGKIGHLIDIATWFWYCKAKKTVKLVLSVIFMCLSVMVLIGEISIFSGTAINPFYYIIGGNNNHVFGTQFLVIFPLLYITYCVYYGMFQVKLAGFFGLYKHHQSDAPSLMFFSINFARVTAPISFNYLKILGVKGSAFVQILGSMDDVPILGSANTYFFPLILIMLILFNAFDVYVKILSALGLKQFEFSDSFDDEQIDQGKGLINKARDQWSRKFEKMRSGSSNLFQGYNTASSLRENEFATNFGRSYGNEGESTDSESGIRISSSSSSTPSSSQKNAPKQIGSKYQKFDNFDEILKI